MRFVRLFFADLRFQWKYGFYFLYTILTALYIGILSVIPTSWKDKTAAILIFSDPAALGLFFMGAIVLLEKSQRVLNSLAISPMKVSEYIISKVLSLGLISTIVAVFIGLVAGNESLILIAFGTFLGSALLSILGLILASRINSLNQFILITVHIECIILVPAIFNLFGFEHTYLRFHPGIIVLHLISSVSENPVLSIVVLISWIVFFYFLAHKSICKMMKSLGGVKF